MEGSRGTTIQIYLPDDDPRGIRIAEVTTGIVSAVQIPRPQIHRVRDLCADLRLPEAAVYLLFESTDDSAKPRVYIGQSDRVSRRLKDHELRRDFWETAVFFVSQKHSFTPAHTEYLEWHATDVAARVNRFNVIPNKSACPNVRLPLRQEILQCFDVVRLLSAALGFPIFDPLVSGPKSINDQNILTCSGAGAKAKGVIVGSDFVVLKGSTARPKLAPSAVEKVSPLRTSLLEAGVLEKQGDLYVFTQDFPFRSPSAAANVVLGRNVNGWDFWEDKSGKTIDEIYRRKAEVESKQRISKPN